MSIILWIKTESRCRQCEATERKLTKAGIPYEARSIENTEGKAEQFKDMGLMAAPVLEVDGEARCAGFNPNVADDVIAEYAYEVA